MPLNGGPHVIEEIKSVVVPPLVFAALGEKSYPHYTEQLRLYCFLEKQERSPRWAASCLSTWRMVRRRKSRSGGRLMTVSG